MGTQFSHCYQPNATSRMSRGIMLCFYWSKYEIMKSYWLIVGLKIYNFDCKDEINKVLIS